LRPSLKGPWTYRGLLTGSGKYSFTIHPGIAEFKGKSYLFLHNANLWLWDRIEQTQPPQPFLDLLLDLFAPLPRLHIGFDHDAILARNRIAKVVNPRHLDHRAAAPGLAGVIILFIATTIIAIEEGTDRLRRLVIHIDRNLDQFPDNFRHDYHFSQ
jgi:hypothetical protein